VGDRRTERPVLSPYGVDMDPLVIAGGVGEHVDALLVDLHPGAGTEVGADEAGQRRQGVNDGWSCGLPLFVGWRSRGGPEVGPADLAGRGAR